MTLPGHGPDRPVSLPDAARMAEDLGFDSVWMSDHVVMVEDATSQYPFDPDGAMRWDVDHPMFDALVSLAVAGAVTTRIGLGTSVLIAPMRNPVVLAKQVATLDLLAGGRLTLGVAVGWLAEEFAALGTPFADRGTRLDEWITILRDCWTGRPAPHHYEHWIVPPGVHCYPTPRGRIPILAGGDSRPALRRAARHADGWIGFQYTEAIDLDRVRAGIRVIGEEAALAGRPRPARLAMQTPGPTGPLAEHLPDLVSAGITEVVVSVDWTAPDRVRASLDLLRRSAP